MKNYEHYMIIAKFNESANCPDEWMLAEFPYYAPAISFCDAFIPFNDIEKIEIQGTNEPVDSYLSADTLYIRDLKKGTSLDLTALDPRIENIAARLYDEEDTETMEDIELSLSTVSGCHDIIIYLLNTIDSILE